MKSVKRQATLLLVILRSFAHKGLKRLYVDDTTRGLPPDAVEKLRAMLSFLENMSHPEQLNAFPSWRAHQLTGNRKSVWSLHVTRNWRLAFRTDNDEILDVNFEDYH